ncbi:hypothetical protein [Leptolyngbya sp. FACHB-16]|nr:hypothetical protein [Leptolyngbya sp. FACHB-16]
MERASVYAKALILLSMPDSAGILVKEGASYNDDPLVQACL